MNIFSNNIIKRITLNNSSYNKIIIFKKIFFKKYHQIDSLEDIINKFIFCI